MSIKIITIPDSKFSAVRSLLGGSSLKSGIQDSSGSAELLTAEWASANGVDASILVNTLFFQGFDFDLINGVNSVSLLMAQSTEIEEPELDLTSTDALSALLRGEKRYAKVKGILNFDFSPTQYESPYLPAEQTNRYFPYKDLVDKEPSAPRFSSDSYGPAVKIEGLVLDSTKKHDIYSSLNSSAYPGYGVRGTRTDWGSLTYHAIQSGAYLIPSIMRLEGGLFSTDPNVTESIQGSLILFKANSSVNLPTVQSSVMGDGSKSFDVQAAASVTMGNTYAGLGGAQKYLHCQYFFNSILYTILIPFDSTGGVSLTGAIMFQGPATNHTSPWSYRSNHKLEAIPGIFNFGFGFPILVSEITNGTDGQSFDPSSYCITCNMEQGSISMESHISVVNTTFFQAKAKTFPTTACLPQFISYCVRMTVEEPVKPGNETGEGHQSEPESPGSKGNDLSSNPKTLSLFDYLINFVKLMVFWKKIDNQSNSLLSIKKKAWGGYDSERKREILLVEKAEYDSLKDDYCYYADIPKERTTSKLMVRIIGFGRRIAGKFMSLATLSKKKRGSDALNETQAVVFKKMPVAVAYPKVSDLVRSVVDIFLVPIGKMTETDLSTLVPDLHLSYSLRVVDKRATILMSSPQEDDDCIKMNIWIKSGKAFCEVIPTYLDISIQSIFNTLKGNYLAGRLTDEGFAFLRVPLGNTSRLGAAVVEEVAYLGYADWSHVLRQVVTGAIVEMTDTLLYTPVNDSDHSLLYLYIRQYGYRASTEYDIVETKIIDQERILDVNEVIGVPSSIILLPDTSGEWCVNCLAAHSILVRTTDNGVRERGRESSWNYEYLKSISLAKKAESETSIS